ncbi:MAG TPA: acyl-CoA dehydrogenase family protein [Acidimicrobiales bacterium]
MSTPEIEDLDSFRERARTFIRENIKPIEADAMRGLLRNDKTDEEELAEVQHERDLQRMLFDAGLAGVCVPVEYGGRGLTPAHQRVLNEEITGYEFPRRLQAPPMSPCMAVLLDFGTEEQKKEHVPKILRGEEIWMQLLSEPSNGSDVAAALTTAVRDGDEWILNGSKVWTTGAWWSDWGLCLARTNWDVPKHRGLTVFILPLHREGVEVQRIALLNGFKDFCQEFLTDVRIPDTDRIGEVDDGWTVGTRWMFHERMLHHSPYVTMPVKGTEFGGGAASAVLANAEATGHLDDPLVRDMVGEARMLDLVGTALQHRLVEGMTSGAMNDQSAAIVRLFGGVSSTRTITLAHEAAGVDGGAWTDDDGALVEVGIDYLMRQTSQIGGGTTEIARNVIAERVLGMPRELSKDRDVAFRDVPRGPT